MKKSEKLLEAIGAIDERHLPDPNELLDIQNVEDAGEEAEMRFSDDYQGKRLPLRAAVIPALLTAAAVAVGIALKYYPIPTEPDYTFESSETTSSLTEADNPTSPSGTTAGTLFEGTELAPLDLIGCYIDEEGHYRANDADWKLSDDYELFRKYFFGEWEGSFTFVDRSKRDLLIIDDSLKSYNMADHNSILYKYYEVNDHVLAFFTGGVEGTSILWIDTDNPDTMYTTWGGVGENNWLWSRDDDGRMSSPKVYTLTKTDAPPNEPEDGFLSIFRLREISRDYGIDIDMLVDIEYETDFYIGDNSYFVTQNGVLREKLYHDDRYQFYPVYLVSEAPDKLEFKTRIGNIMYSHLEGFEANAEYTLEKTSAGWKRTVLLTFSDGSTVTLAAAKPLPEKEAFSALELLAYYIDGEGNYRTDESQWRTTQDYELFRKYFFGTWGNEFSDNYSSWWEHMVIDDSEQSSVMTEKYDWYSGLFYEVNDRTLAFVYNNINGSSVCWIDTDNPDTMYYTYGHLSAGNSVTIPFFYNGLEIYALPKTDKAPNEPENGFLSIFKIYEMSYKYGIDLEMLTDIKYSDDSGTFSVQHNGNVDFYPIYLVSEASDKIVLKTVLRDNYNYFYEDQSKAAEADYTIEKINGKWTRTVILTLPDGTTVPLETADTEKEQPDDQEIETVTTETAAVPSETSAETTTEPVSAPPAAEANGSSELIVHRFDIASDSHMDGCFPVEYDGIVYNYYFVNGSYIIDADNNITHRGTYGEEQLDPEYELDALLMNFEELEYVGKVDIRALNWSSDYDTEYADMYKHGDNLIFLFNFFIPTQEVLFCRGYFGFEFTIKENQRLIEDRSSIRDILAEHGIDYDPSIFYDAVMFTKGELRWTYEYEDVYSIIK